MMSTNANSISAMEHLPAGDGLDLAGFAAMLHALDLLSAPSHAPILVGRDSERVFLHEELTTALSGRGRLVIIGGEAGIGKTTLARDLAAVAAERGALVLGGHCYDLTNTPPYGPWLDLFADYPAAAEPPPPEPFEGGRLRGTVTDQAALFERVRVFLTELTATRPLVILLEDLHWADPVSIELLRYLGPWIGRMPLLLMVTYRVDELTRRHPFFQNLPALIRESGGLRLDLRRLLPDDLRDLATRQYRLSADDENRLVGYLSEHAEGNPFFAVELLRALREAGLLRPAPGGWAVAELDRLVMPALLSQVIDGRVARLGEETRGLLALAAVIGQEVPLDLWSQVGGIDDEHLFELVERAVEANLLDAERQGTRVRFVHALTREALYESVLPPRRRIWHRQIAEALAMQPDAQPDAVAAHLQRAGDSRAAEWLTRAGDRAQRAYALLTAAERFRAAAELLETEPGRERDRAFLLYRGARLLRFSDPAASIRMLEEVERLARVDGDQMLLGEVLNSLGVVRFYGDDPDGSARDLAAGTDLLDALPEDVAHAPGSIEVWLADALPAHGMAVPEDDGGRIPTLSINGLHVRRATTSWMKGVSGQLGEARDLAETFVAGVAPGQSLGGLADSSLGHAWQGLGSAYAGLGMPENAKRAFARARKRYRWLDHHAVIAFSLLTELRDVQVPYGADDLGARQRLALQAEEAMRRAGGGLVPGMSPWLACLGRMVLDGEWDEAMAVAEELPASGNCYLRREITATVATLARHRGETDRAWAAIGSVMTDGTATAPGSRIFQEALFLQRLAVDLALDAGDLRTARSWLDANDRWLTWNGAVLGRADGQLGWARYHHANGDRAKALASANEALALASEPRQPLALLAAHRRLGMLAGEAGNAGEAERQFAVALDLAAACGALFERALTLLALAEVRSKQREPNGIGALVEEIVAIGRPLRAAPLLARAEAVTRPASASPSTEVLPFGLTGREAEVVRLLSEGLTDVGIAERLYISPRTVQQHLRSVYGKMAVSSRAGATRLALEHGLA